jgi:hypothetical protein
MIEQMGTAADPMAAGNLSPTTIGEREPSDQTEWAA